MVNALLKLVKKCLDGPTLKLFSQPWANRGMDYLGYQQKRARRRFLEKRLRANGSYGDVVQQGPFTGLRYPADGFVSCRFQKVVGVYEHELNGLLEVLIARNHYRHIIDVGAAEGYFAVGLALKFPQAKNIAYEMTEASRAMLHRVAVENKVRDRLQIEGQCSPETLGDLTAQIEAEKTLLVCDVDGYEVELLTSGKVPWLHQADILLELHDCLRPGVTDLIVKAFSATHKLTLITNAGIPYANYPVLRQMPFTDIYALVNEDRQGLQDWLFMTPDATLHASVAPFAS